jgi:phage terminase small subunit
MSTGTPKLVSDLGVTTSQRRFLEEYIAFDGNATQAYLKAFPEHSYGTARCESSKLLANPSIQAELQAMREGYARDLRISGLKVLKELAAVAFSDIGEVFEEVEGEFDRAKPPSRIRPLARKAVQVAKVKRRKVKSKASDDLVEEVEEVEYKLYSKLDALDKLCKKLGLFKDDDKPVDGMTEAEKIALVRMILGGTATTPEGGE